VEHGRNQDDYSQRASLENIAVGLQATDRRIERALGPARPPDEIVLFDSRMFRDLRKQEIGKQLSLTGGAKIGLWVGVGVGAIWLYNDIKHTTEDLVDCIFSGGCPTE